MTWCNRIKSENIKNMNEQGLRETLNNCEKTCEKYHLCDTVAMMEDEIKVKEGEADYCCKCGKLIIFDNETYYLEADEDKFYCEECGDEESLTQCDNCGDWFKGGKCEEKDGMILCPYCLKEE